MALFFPTFFQRMEFDIACGLYKSFFLGGRSFFLGGRHRFVVCPQYFKCYVERVIDTEKNKKKKKQKKNEEYKSSNTACWEEISVDGIFGFFSGANI